MQDWYGESTSRKTGGGTRPLGILTLEDKLVQRVTADIFV